MITKLFIDTKVMMDLLGERVPHYDSIAKIVTLADKGKVKMVVSAFSYPAVYYLLTKFESTDKVKEKLRKFKIISEISDLDKTIIEKGLASNFSDFEDALQYHCALKADCDIIITRNAKDFKESAIPLMSGGGISSKPQKIYNLRLTACITSPDKSEQAIPTGVSGYA